MFRQKFRATHTRARTHQQRRCNLHKFFGIDERSASSDQLFIEYNNLKPRVFVSKMSLVKQEITRRNNIQIESNEKKYQINNTKNTIHDAWKVQENSNWRHYGMMDNHTQHHIRSSKNKQWYRQWRCPCYLCRHMACYNCFMNCIRRQ